jgi:single-strand DNA-binding protein
MAVEQGGTLPVCLSGLRSACRAQRTPPVGGTLSFPKSATRLAAVRTPYPRAMCDPLSQILSSRLGSGSRRHTRSASIYRRQRTNEKETEPNNIINKVILIARLGQNAEAETAQNNCEYVVLNIATQESWKNDKGDYETRTEWHRVYAWKNLSKFAKTLQKGQLITLEGTLRYREVEDEIESTTFKHRIAEIHATSMKRLLKIETDDDPAFSSR